MASVWDKIQDVIYDIENIDLDQGKDEIQEDLNSIIGDLEGIQSMLY